MSYIETLSGFRYPWYVHLLFWLQRRRYGRELEPSRLWGRTPRAFLAMAAMYRALDRKSSPIEPALRSLVQVHVSQLNWCPFCVDLNSASGLERGVAAVKLTALPHYAGSERFSEREQAALAYAEAVTRGDKGPGPAMIERLRRYFDDDAIIELTALTAFQNMSSKFNAALGVPVQGFCTIPR